MYGVAPIKKLFHGGAEPGDAGFRRPAVGIDVILGGALVESFLVSVLCQSLYRVLGMIRSGVF